MAGGAPSGYGPKTNVIMDKEAFAAAVMDIVRLVPRGRATSYGAIAHAVGHPALPRMVGRIMGGAEGVPAHRVVGSGGMLTGHMAFGAPGRMRELLEAEGVEVVNNRIRNWKQVFWDPLKEIGM